ncbi:MAG TPA: DUF5818 domain-containing protein [Terriglobia bacterium]|nr:DUF5818 domain-containing protein [Terriglobia bacterium]
MIKRLIILVATLLAASVLAFSADKTTLTGVVSDSHCGAKHAAASDQAATCVGKCVAGGASYVLVADGKVYQLDNQDKFKDLAGKSAKVTGTVDGDKVAVESVEAAAQQ